MVYPGRVKERKETLRESGPPEKKVARALPG